MIIYDKQVYTEVYFILNNLSEELKNKIPQELKDFIVDNADISYHYRIDELLPESKALIASILEKYINI